MSISISKFWNLVIESQLLASSQCKQLVAEYGKVAGAAQADDVSDLSDWLVAGNVISRYQSKVLLAGHAGPFVYDEYKVYDRLDTGRLTGDFRAIHIPTAHPVLLQFLTGPLTQDAGLWRKSVQRIAKYSEWQHPNTQSIFAGVDVPSFKFLVSEDLQGASVEEWLAHSGPIATFEACRLIRLAAFGLAQMHHAGEIHGDVRPGNLWIEPNGNLKLLKNPLERARAPQLDVIDASQQLLKQADYFAPEFSQPRQQPNALTDLYALGCSFYEMLTGRHPFTAVDVAGKVQQHVSQAIPVMEPFGIPPQLAQIVHYLMAKNPEARYQQASLVAEHLVPFVEPAKLQFVPVPPAATQAAFEDWLSKRREMTATDALDKSARMQAVMQGRTSRSAKGVRVAASSIEIETNSSSREVSTVAPAASNNKTNSMTTTRSGTFSQRRQRGPSKKSLGLRMGAALAIAAVLLGAGLWTLNQNTTSETKPAENEQITEKDEKNLLSSSDEGRGEEKKDLGNKNPEDNGPQVVSPEPSVKQIIVEDAAEDLLWASPTTGDEISLRFLPPGAQILVVARLGEIVALPEGEKVIRALGPTFQKGQETWEVESGVRFDQVAQVIMAFYGNLDQPPRKAFVVHLKDAQETETLLNKWGNPSKTGEGTATYYKGRSRSFFAIPENDQIKMFTMGADEDIQELAAVNGAKPPIHSHLNRLQKVGDVDRHVNVFFAQKFLFGDGQKIFTGERRRVMPAVGWFLGDEVTWGLISMHFSEHFYLEMRACSDISKDARTLAGDLRGRLEMIPEIIERYNARINPHPYWKMISNRYPMMVRFLSNHARSGVEEQHAVINAVLPKQAAHNLVFGGAMLLDSTPGISVVAVESAGHQGPKSLEELLDSSISYSFDQKSFEDIMRDLEAVVKDDFQDLPFDFKVRVMGADLEAEGITRNKEVRDFNAENKMLGEVITRILQAATGVRKPASDPEQKLIWVLGPDPDDSSKKVILITTRVAAEQKGYMLPNVFNASVD